MALFIQGIAMCAAFTLLILPPLFKSPLTQIASYPPAIRERVASLPQYQDILEEAKRKNVTRKIVGALIAVILLAFVAFFSGKTTFASAFLHVFILFMVVNLYDLVILDFVIFSNSKSVIIPGTEDMVREYKNPMHHMKSAIKGISIGIVVSALAGGIVEIVSRMT